MPAATAKLRRILATPVSVRRSVKVRVYPVVDSAMEDACLVAWRRLWKHREAPAGLPDEHEVASEIHAAVMLALSELFDFGE